MVWGMSGYAMNLSVELRQGPTGCHVLLVMDCAFFRDTLRAWEIEAGQAYVFEEKPEQMAAFVAEKLREVLR